MKPRIRDKDQSNSPLGSAQKAYDIVRQRILDGSLAPGDHVGEAELAQAAGLSRTPVREAMRTLHAEGLLDATAGRGHNVTVMTAEQVEQLFYMREATEGMAARLAAIYASAEALDRMSELLHLEATTDKIDSSRLLNINDEFHRCIHHASQNMYIKKTMRHYETAMILVRAMTSVSFTPSPDAHDHHLAVFDAISSEDPSRAENEMRNHIRMSRRKRTALLKKHPIW